MAVDFLGAINAYANANRMVGGAASATSAGASAGQSFGQLVQQAASGVVGDLNKEEQLSMQAVTGHADLTAVTEAVTNAQVALQTVVAIRDKVISAYQDIMQMPI
jgi:flagellar hook-basal body complex protein FliE